MFRFEAKLKLVKSIKKLIFPFDDFNQKSSSFEERVEIMRQLQVEKTRTQIVEPNSLLNNILGKQLEIDRDEEKNLRYERNFYLYSAVSSYLACLQQPANGGEPVSATMDNAQNLCIFRLVALWTQVNIRDFSLRKNNNIIISIQFINAWCFKILLK